MSLNILHHKSWHVWRRDNIQRVERDEAAVEAKATAAAMAGASAEHAQRLRALRRRGTEPGDPSAGAALDDGLSDREAAAELPGQREVCEAAVAAEQRAGQHPAPEAAEGAEFGGDAVKELRRSGDEWWRDRPKPQLRRRPGRGGAQAPAGDAAASQAQAEGQREGADAWKRSRLGFTDSGDGAAAIADAIDRLKRHQAEEAPSASTAAAESGADAEAVQARLAGRLEAAAAVLEGGDAGGDAGRCGRSAKDAAGMGRSAKRARPDSRRRHRRDSDASCHRDGGGGGVGSAGVGLDAGARSPLDRSRSRSRHAKRGRRSRSEPRERTFGVAGSIGRAALPSESALALRVGLDSDALAALRAERKQREAAEARSRFHRDA